MGEHTNEAPIPTPCPQPNGPTRILTLARARTRPSPNLPHQTKANCRTQAGDKKGLQPLKRALHYMRAAIEYAAYLSLTADPLPPSPPPTPPPSSTMAPTYVCPPTHPLTRRFARAAKLLERRDREEGVVAKMLRLYARSAAACRDHAAKVRPRPISS